MDHKNIGKLFDACEPAARMLREKGSPYDGVLITPEGIRLINVEAGRPVKEGMITDNADT